MGARLDEATRRKAETEWARVHRSPSAGYRTVGEYVYDVRMEDLAAQHKANARRIAEHGDAAIRQVLIAATIVIAALLVVAACAIALVAA